MIGLIIINTELNFSKGNNYSDLLIRNRSLVVKLLMKNGNSTRSEISRITGLSQAAITKIASDLISIGLIEEIGHGKGEKGRRTIEIRLKSESYSVIGVKISRRSYSIGHFSIGGQIHNTEVHKILPSTPAIDVVSAIAKKINCYCANINTVIAVGISVPGPYLARKGVIANMTEFSGWDEINIVDFFKENVHVPTFIEHDANAGAMAEWWFGSIQCRTLVHIVASEGIGAGIINNGKLLYGADGTAGEIGHMSIAFDGRRCQCSSESRGCLEQYCSSLAFLRDVREQINQNPSSSLTKIPDFTVDNIFNEAKNGDEFCKYMVSQAGFFFGIGIANIVNIYNPDVIVISDIMTGAGELLLNSIENTVKAKVLPALLEDLRISFSQLKCDSILFGAAAVAVDRFLGNPLKFTDTGIY